MCGDITKERYQRLIDNYDLWCEYDRQQEEELRKRPKCDCCGEYIQEDFCYRIGIKLYCEYCMEENKVSVETLMD